MSDKNARGQSHFPERLRILQSNEFLVENHGLQSGNLDGFAATGIFASQFIVYPNTIIARFGEPGAIPFVGIRRNGLLFGSAPPPDRVFLRCPAFGTIYFCRHDLVFFDKEIPFFHRIKPRP
jgi:hypothetical protein